MAQKLINFDGLKAVVEKIYTDIQAKADATHTHGPEDIIFSDDKNLTEKLADIQAGGEVSLEGYATETYVQQQIEALVGEGTPEALDTLKELATALGDDANFAATVTTQLGNKVDKVEGSRLMTEEEGTKLAGLENYDDSALDARVQVLEAIDHDAFLTEHQDISGLATKEEVEAVDAKIGVQAVEAAEGVDPVEATGLYKYVDDKVAAVEYEVATVEELEAMYDELKNA